MTRSVLAVCLGKLIFFLTRFFRVGGGSAAPGLYALKIEPDLIPKLVSKIPLNIIITGTNGKTTTARMLNHLAKSQGFKVIRNSTGSNLERGIVSTLISHSHIPSGKLEFDLGIWELDEAAFNKVVFNIKPQIIIFLNAFRDQLDRYGEVDNVVKNWRKTLEQINWNPQVLINSSDANTATLASVGDTQFLLFGAKDGPSFGEKALFSTKKLKNDFEAKIVKSKGLLGTEVEIRYPKGIKKFFLPIPGVYHVYDFLAAFAVYSHLNLPVDEIATHLKHFTPAFGRVEKFSFGYIFLIKNPAGATMVFETICSELKREDRMLLALNDNFADGKDVSWIWDVNFEQLAINNEQLAIICSGSRAQDVALRLKYAGFNPKQIKVENNLNKALKLAKADLRGKLFILPTYTALLKLQKILAEAGHKKHYWVEA